MFGIIGSCQTIGCNIMDFGVIGDDDYWVVVLEWGFDGKHTVRWQDVDIAH